MAGKISARINLNVKANKWKNQSDVLQKRHFVQEVKLQNLASEQPDNQTLAGMVERFRACN